MNKFYEKIRLLEIKFNKLMTQAELEMRLLYSNALGFPPMDFDMDELMSLEEMQEDLDSNIKNVSNDMGKRKRNRRKNRGSKPKQVYGHNVMLTDGPEDDVPEEDNIIDVIEERRSYVEDPHEGIVINDFSDAEKLLGRERVLQLVADYCEDRISKQANTFTTAFEHVKYQIEYNHVAPF